MQIVKRDGAIESFNTEKITNAICKAMDETDRGVDLPLALEIATDIESINLGKGDEPCPTDVEEVQDIVEELLSQHGRFDVAKRYIIYREERAKCRNKAWEMSDLQRDIYDNKYRYNGESFSEFIKRVSGGNKEVGKLIRNKDFTFAGRILAGRGLDRNVTMSNCYVNPQPEDNLESIFDTAKESARTYSYGGGMGFDISLLRPKGSPVNNSALTTSGAVSFMELYSLTTGLIGQRGRRGALMISMSVDHPDILDFINVKRDLDNVTNANISVRFNDEFFRNIDDEHNQKVLTEIAESNWQSGEPGSLYWDAVQNWHLLQHHPEYVMTSTNPCGEQPLPDYGNCLLGSINLANFVIDPFTDKARIDYERFGKVVRTSTIGLNEVLEEGIPLHPLKEQRATAEKFRQIGLGIMGLADMFIKLGIKYGSGDSRHISMMLATILKEEAILQSVELAKTEGTYPAFDREIVAKSDYFRSLPRHIQDAIMKHGMRNSHVTSIAPTGSISTMWGVSGGIEPIFATSYTRTTKSLAEDGDTIYRVYTDVIKELMEATGAENDKNLPEYVVTSHDIKPIGRIKLQSNWQKHIDSAISSTVNLDEDTTVEEIKEIYIRAWENNLKGITVFRNNCFRMGILNTDKPEVEIEDDGDCAT